MADTDQDLIYVRARRLPYETFDADNHLYENTDALTKFLPKDEVQQDFYSGKPVQIHVTGNYNNLGQFFAQMASYQRIVSITDFKVTKLRAEKGPGDVKSNETVSAEFLVTAYYVSPEKLQAPPPEPEEKKGKGKKDKKEKKDKAPKAEPAE